MNEIKEIETPNLIIDIPIPKEDPSKLWVLISQKRTVEPQNAFWCSYTYPYHQKKYMIEEAHRMAISCEWNAIKYFEVRL